MSVYLPFKAVRGKTVENIPWTVMFLKCFHICFSIGPGTQVGAGLGQILVGELRALK